ncbi:hypothetical protein LTR53_000190 [Teratosphaeriaceae sp. CCFEE 6253]|nr:hypothetical protein LTR53_000190 [Teratosphaeriaceae sp. CCFEE 6253]
MMSTPRLATAILYGQGTTLTAVGLLALLRPDFLVYDVDTFATGTPLAFQVKVMSMLSLTLGPYCIATAPFPAIHRRLMAINIALRALATATFWSDARYTAYYEAGWGVLSVAAFLASTA